MAVSVEGIGVVLSVLDFYAAHFFPLVGVGLLCPCGMRQEIDNPQRDESAERDCDSEQE